MVEGLVLDPADGIRLDRTVRRVEQMPSYAFDDYAAALPWRPSILLEARITGPAAGTGSGAGSGTGSGCELTVYPAVVLEWSPQICGWIERMPIWVFALNNATLTTGQEFSVKLIDRTHKPSSESERPLFLVVGGSGAGGCCSGWPDDVIGVSGHFCCNEDGGLPTRLYLVFRSDLCSIRVFLDRTEAICWSRSGRVMDYTECPVEE